MCIIMMKCSLYSSRPFTGESPFGKGKYISSVLFTWWGGRGTGSTTILPRRGITMRDSPFASFAAAERCACYYQHSRYEGYREEDPLEGAPGWWMGVQEALKLL